MNPGVVSIVIPVYNRESFLAEAVESALAQEGIRPQIIVVDDGSTDGTEEMVRREFPQVRYFRQDMNRGPAAARNRGIREATGEIIAFTDDDCLPPQDWLAKLANGYRRYPEVAGVGGGLIAPAEILAANHYARYERYICQSVYHAGEDEYCGGFECPAGGTANMSYQRTVLLKVNGFDEGFPVAAGEDADLKLRICNMGYKLLYVPIWVKHLQEYSRRRFIHQCYVRGIGGSYFEQKHRGGAPSRLKILLRLIKRFITFVHDWTILPDKSIARLKLLEGLYTCWGQWNRR
jgi:glycosyltransferase involved in cell wall biosynthesis